MNGWSCYGFLVTHRPPKTLESPTLFVHLLFGIYRSSLSPWPQTGGRIHWRLIIWPAKNTYTYAYIYIHIHTLHICICIIIMRVSGGGLATAFCSYKALFQPTLLHKWVLEVKNNQKKPYQKEAPTPSKPPTKRQCDFRCLYRCPNGPFCWWFLERDSFL